MFSTPKTRSRFSQMTSPKIFHRLQTPPQASNSNQYKFSLMLEMSIIDLYTRKAGSQMCKIHLHEEIQAFDTITKDYEANEELSRGFFYFELSCLRQFCRPVWSRQGPLGKRLKFALRPESRLRIPGKSRMFHSFYDPT